MTIPVATAGRINEAWIAEELIEDGAADICMMGRANLCDAEFCNKAAAGRADEVRPCIGCLRCLTGIMFGKPISCTVNPDVEHDEAGCACHVLGDSKQCGNLRDAIEVGYKAACEL